MRPSRASGVQAKVLDAERSGMFAGTSATAGPHAAMAAPASSPAQVVRQIALRMRAPQLKFHANEITCSSILPDGAAVVIGSARTIVFLRPPDKPGFVFSHSSTPRRYAKPSIASRYPDWDRVHEERCEQYFTAVRAWPHASSAAQ